MSDLPETGWNDQIPAFVAKVTEHWVVAVSPMIFNDRIIISPVEDWTTSVTAGWCYDRVEASDPIAATLRTMAIAAEWDPEVDREPRAYKKCAFDARKGSLL